MHEEIATLLVCDTPEKIEKAVSEMTPEGLNRFADSLKTITYLLANKELKKLLIRKLANRLTAIERMPESVRKGIQGQDFDDDGDTKKWPSLTS